MKTCSIDKGNIKLMVRFVFAMAVFITGCLLFCTAVMHDWGIYPFTVMLLFPFAVISWEWAKKGAGR